MAMPLPKVGDKLKNGGTVLACESVIGPYEAIVLAIYYQEFVTWRLDLSTGEARWGRYFHGSDALGQALTDYRRRCM